MSNCIRNPAFRSPPPETWLPWTAGMYQIIDYGKKLSSGKNVPGAVCNEALYRAVAELAKCFFDEELDIPEAF